MSVAVVVVAHDKPRHLHRLVQALDGLPVFLHVDAGASAEMHAALTTGLPDRVRLLPRVRSGWAAYGIVEAELLGHRAAYEQTDAEHVVVMSGADYPLVTAEGLIDRLSRLRGVSWAEVQPLPIRAWGPMLGYDRFVFRNRAEGKRRVWSPVPRRWPTGLRPAGGSQMKILARRHVGRVLDTLDARPELESYFRTTWVPDEVMLPSLLSSPTVGADWQTSHVRGEPAWFIDWGEKPSPSPRWLDEQDLPALRAARTRPGTPALFARKFSEDSAQVLDRIEEELWPLP